MCPAIASCAIDLSLGIFFLMCSFLTLPKNDGYAHIWTHACCFRRESNLSSIVDHQRSNERGHCVSAECQKARASLRGFGYHAPNANAPA
jgi:hypothetical protein